MKRRTFVLSSAAAVAAPSVVRAQQAWPANPLRVMHGYDAGSNPDTIARQISQALGEALNTQIIIEARPGAAERLAATQIARMKPDGSVVYLMTGGQAVVSATDKTLQYDLLRDFDFIGIVTRFPFSCAVAPESRFQTIQAYMDEAKKNPGKLTYSTSGVGSTLHMAIELLLSQTGVSLTHVPYKGGVAAPYNDLVSGRIDMMVVTFTGGQPLMKANKLRALAVTSKERHPEFPTVPTISETLVPGFDVVSWLGFTSPAGLPPALRDRFNEALRQVMARPEIKNKLEELGNDTTVSTPAEFRARVEQDLARWRPLAHVVNQS
jgi:tripartite-type tricarboxylate transporter receptor subunit TctC